VLDQIMHRMLKGAGLELFLIVDHDHGILVVVVLFEAWHADGSTPCLFLRSYQNLVRLGFFYSLNALNTGMVKLADFLEQKI